MFRVFKIEVGKFESELLLLDVSDNGPGFGCTLPDRIKRRTENLESKGEKTTMPKVKKL